MEIKIAQINCVMCVKTTLIMLNTTGNLKIKFGLEFWCSECIVECVNNELPHTNNLFDSDSESEDEVNDVKD